MNFIAYIAQLAKFYKEIRNWKFLHLKIGIIIKS